MRRGSGQLSSLGALANDRGSYAWVPRLAGLPTVEGVASSLLRPVPRGAALQTDKLTNGPAVAAPPVAAPYRGHGEYRITQARVSFNVLATGASGPPQVRRYKPSARDVAIDRTSGHQRYDTST